MQALCLNVRVIDENGQEIEIRELDEDAFRTTESLGIDLSRPERGTEEDDEQRGAQLGYDSNRTPDPAREHEERRKRHCARRERRRPAVDRARHRVPEPPVGLV